VAVAFSADGSLFYLTARNSLNGNRPVLEFLTVNPGLPVAQVTGFGGDNRSHWSAVSPS